MIMVSQRAGVSLWFVVCNASLVNLYQLAGQYVKFLREELVHKIAPKFCSKPWAFQ